MAAPMLVTLVFRNSYKFCRISALTYPYSVRLYAKALRRKPLRVLTAQEADDLSNKYLKRTSGNDQLQLMQGNERLEQFRKPEKTNDTTNKLEIKSAEKRNHERAKKQNRVTRNDKESTKVIDKVTCMDNEDVKFEKLNEGDKRFGPAVLNAKLSRVQNKKPTILLEGKRLILEAINASVTIKTIFFTHNELLEDIPLKKLVKSGMKLFKVKPKQMKIWSDTVSPMGIMAICNKPKAVMSSEQERLPITVICDEVSDPGVLGTIIRSSTAACVNKILITRARSADPWEPKALRAGAGAHFYVPLIEIDWEKIPGYLTDQSFIYILNSQESTENENQKKLSRIELEKIVNTNENENQNVTTTKKDKRGLAELCRSISLPVSSYDSVDYADREVVVVLGNEGSNPDARRLAFTVGGEIVFIPVTNCIHGLNSASAASILLFEVKRQLEQQRQFEQRSDKFSKSILNS